MDKATAIFLPRAKNIQYNWPQLRDVPIWLDAAGRCEHATPSRQRQHHSENVTAIILPVPHRMKSLIRARWPN